LGDVPSITKDFLLTGLLDYYEIFPDRTEALESARRLAGFLGTVTEAAS